MNDFLHFLNTASSDSLTKIPGISPTLAENLIAARPFDAVENCLKVRGMGKNLLVRAQATFEAMEPEPEERAMIPLEPEALPLEKSQPVEEELPREEQPSFGAWLGQALLGFLRAVLRLILLVMVLSGFGAVIYYGVPFLNERFVAPVELNAARVNELENEVANLQTQITEINKQLTETNKHIDNIEQSVEAQTVSLEKLSAIQTKLDMQLKENNDRALLALKHEVLLTRILDMLARARLYLAQSNFGLAKVDVQSARDLLVEVQAGSNDEVLGQAIARLDVALGNLPAFPVVAAGDLEIAWQILMTGKPLPTATPEATSTRTPAPEPPLNATVTTTATP